MGLQQQAVLFQLLLLCSSTKLVLISGQNSGGTGQQPAAPAGSTSTAEVVSDCPAELILAFLKQDQQLQWPPQALKQGLTCTMELSQLTIALPGTSKACTVLAITNNLLSTLYSWQLVWQPASKALTATSATGAVLLNSTGTGDNTVQLINPASSPSIAAKGGSVDMLVQLGFPAPPASAPAGPDGNGSTPTPARRTGSIKPAVEGVYLNGLQCTRLPLARPAAGQVTEDSLYLEDCGTADWPLNANGTLAGLDSTISMLGWGNLTESGGKADSKNASALTAGQMAGMIAALRQLSCVSQLCCGLQVVPNSVVSINGSTDVSNSTEPPVVASEGPTPNRSTGGNASQVGSDDTLPTDIIPAKQQRPEDNSASTSGLVVGLVVAGVVTGCVGALLAVLLRYSHTRRKAMAEQQKQQAAAQQGLMRHGSGASSDGSGGTTSLASLASAEWQQQQQHYTGTASSRPPVPWLRAPLHMGPLPTHQTAPPHLLTAAAASAAADMPSSSVWRAGSWQGPDAYTPAGVRSQLERSSSSPQPLQRTTTASTGTPHHTWPAPVLVTTSTPNSPLTAHLHLPPTGPSRSLQAAAAFGCEEAGAAAGSSGAVAGSSISPAAGAMGVMSATGSPRDALGSSANYSSLNSTWGSLRRMLGNNRVPPPKSSTLASATNSSIGLMRHGSNQGPDTEEGGLGTLGTGHTLSRNGSATGTHAVGPTAAASHRDHAGQLTMTSYTPPLQLIQEAAPLSGAAFPVHALRQQQLQLLAGAGAATHMGFVSGRGGDGAAVSRRISPILSVLEDNSSATSTDSMTPAAWHLTDRQLLEDTPGWLNIDFASEVRLEKKLGEGGFGQVFRARWRDEVIAAKLVPFMSLVAQQHHSMSMSLVSAAVGTSDATSAAAAGQPPLSQGTGTTTDGSQLGNMRLGVQFSSGSLRAIKVEIRVLSQLSHPNIVAFKGACMAPPHICILEELAEGGSLYSRLYSRSSASKAQQQQRQRQQQQQALAPGSRSSGIPTPLQKARKAGAGSSSGKGALPPPLSVSEVLRIAVDVSRAMVYLHTLQPQVVHRDLKPQNVLLDLQGRAKVCDFGISKMKDASLAASSTRLQAGTPAYMAPEQFEGCSVTDKVDVFAFGVMLWECFEQQQPWKELSPMQIIYSVGLQKERLQRPARCPDQLWQLIDACWAQDPRDRPSFADTLQTLQQLQQEQGQISVGTQQEAAAEAAASKQLQVAPDHHHQQQQQQQIAEAAQAPQLQEQVKLDTSQASVQPAPQKMLVAAEALTQSAEVSVDQAQVENQDEVDGHVAVVC